MGNLSESVRWVDAFPWLVRSARIDSYAPGDTPAPEAYEDVFKPIKVDSVHFDRIALEVANDAYRNFPGWELGELFPAIPSEYTFNFTDIAGIGKKSDVLLKSTKWTSVDHRVILDFDMRLMLDLTDEIAFLASLAKVNARAATGDSLLPPWRNVAASSAVKGQKPSFGLHESVSTIVNWLDASQDEPTRVFEIVASLEGAPENVISAAGAVQKFVAGKRFVEAPAKPIYEVLEDFLDGLSEREERVVHTRILAEPRIQLELVGYEFNVTRERVRQIEAQLSARLAEWLATDEDAQAHSNHIRNCVGKFARLSTLTNAFPSLLELVVPFNLPAWYVFDKFDDSFESDGTWVAVPSLKSIEQEFDNVFTSHEETGGYISLSKLRAVCSDWESAGFEDLVQWATGRGYEILDDYLLAPTRRSMLSRAAIALSISGEPMTLDELHQSSGPDKSIRSLANQLAEDPRFIRTAASMWSLAEWGGESYTSIREAILARVDSGGGLVSLQSLLDELPARFGIAASSVRTYSNSWPLETVGDNVRRAQVAVPKARPIERTRNVYSADGGYVWRVITSTDHLRGSGSAFPGALAGALGLVPGGSISFNVEGSHRTVTLRWTGNQATIATVKSLFEELGTTVGEPVEFTFAGSTVRVRKGSVAKGSAESRVRALLCINDQAVVTRRSISQRLGLPTDSLWHEIIENVEARKESELLSAIEEMNASYTS